MRMPVLWFVLLVVSLFAWSCQGCDEQVASGKDCATMRCDADQVCQAGVCVAGELPDSGWDSADRDLAGTGCDAQRVPCNGMCCAAGLVCNAGQCQAACENTVCAGQCCAPGEACESGVCSAPCAGERCGDGLALCCDVEDVCFGGGCVSQGASCTRTEECDIREVCEPSLGRCLSRDQIAVCEYRPPVGEFSPTVGCSWVPDGLDFPNRGDIVATPVVANLTDDNGDGRTDTDDIPNIVFLSFNRNAQGCCNVASTIRIVDGECNPDGTMNTVASISEPALTNDSGLALADLTGDGVPEIIAITMNNDATRRPQGTAAFRRTSDDGASWELLWHNTTYPRWNVHTRGGATISVADLDADGKPEIIIGNVVLNGQTGELKWDGLVTSGGAGGIGNNAFLGPSSTVADVNLNGKQEVIAGNTLYDHEGNVIWTYQFTSNNSACGGQLPCDGFNAVANFDEDPEAEIVIVRLGEVFILNHDGTLLWKMALPKRDCALNEAGPPTVADFNGDGRPEIGTAGADYYIVAKMECDVDGWEALGCAERGILWKTINEDCSSRATASSVFDFEGDGKAEMVYADETTFRIFDGTTGAILFEDDQHQSNTRIEMPIIADVNNDGHANVVVAAAYSNRGDRAGLKVWKDLDGNWVRTRRIWNQHGYHVTNITEEGKVPAQPQRNWQHGRLNNFRQNVQPDGLFDAPDLVVKSITLDNPNSCAVEARVDLTVVVANEGALYVPAGVSVLVEVVLSDRTETVATLATTQRLLPGQFETLKVSWALPQNLINASFAARATVDADERFNECNEENNRLNSEPIRCTLQG
ncbi:MAG: VCBS repeat-containing protein [Bradymonadaceae bacterium]|nr:VCBS repeat-containing protein [Lujinxingiaceae bacterium]